ncbi:MAG TPA: hypothetical protein VJ579_01015 [Candidatus Paceibacterota bacterium]|nr:hypothetical protein [Candidatus Paceibacterota bacterium]
MATIRSKLIEDRLGKLINMFGRMHDPVDVLELIRLFEKHEFRGMVAVIKRQMRLSMPIRVCYVNDPRYGPEKCVAWVDGLNFVPFFGTQNIRGEMASMYLRQHALVDMPSPSLIFAIAHELAHVLLTAFRSELNTDEEATDLLAILLGYGTCYAAGKTYQCKYPFGANFPFERSEFTSGYLSIDEIIYAEMLIRR